jgi:hypothetical protein
MGCHTWFWKPTTKTKEQLQDIVTAYCTEQIREYSEPAHIDYLLSCTYEDHGFTMSLQDIENQRNFYTRWLRRIQSNKSIWKTAIYSYQLGDAYGCMTRYREGVLYEEYELHDLFRAGWYDSPDLLSVEEVLDFLAVHKVELTIDALLRLYHFFYSAPTGGLVTFG